VADVTKPRESDDPDVSAKHGPTADADDNHHGERGRGQFGIDGADSGRFARDGAALSADDDTGGSDASYHRRVADLDIRARHGHDDYPANDTSINDSSGYDYVGGTDSRGTSAEWSCSSHSDVTQKPHSLDRTLDRDASRNCRCTEPALPDGQAPPFAADRTVLTPSGRPNGG
jgi:hypothetical protein